jgi:hypothetical protein
MLFQSLQIPFEYTGEAVVAKVEHYTRSAVVPIADKDSIASARYMDTLMLLLVDDA